MTNTAFALALIKEYTRQHNRYRRATKVVREIWTPKHESYRRAMHKQGLSPTGTFTRPIGPHQYRTALRHFQDIHGSPVRFPFVSGAMKGAAVRSAKIAVQKARWCAMEKSSDPNNEARMHLAEKELNEISEATVATELAKIWRQYVKALYEEQKAREERYAVRSAIKLFNRMDTGIKIKFGTCRPGGGSMSAIHHVRVDGENIPLAKFIANAEFEVTVLGT